MLQQLIAEWLQNPERLLIQKKLIALFTQRAEIMLRRFNNIPSADRDEIRQDVVTELLKRLKTGYVNQGSELGLLYRLCNNAAIDWLRRQETQKNEILNAPIDETIPMIELHQGVEGDSTDEPETPEYLCLREEERRHLRKLFGRYLSLLPPSQRRVIQAMYIDDRSNQEITQERFDETLQKDGIALSEISEKEDHARWKNAQDWLAQNKKRGLKALEKAILQDQGEENEEDA